MPRVSVEEGSFPNDLDPSRDRMKLKDMDRLANRLADAVLAGSSESSGSEEGVKGAGAYVGLLGVAASLQAARAFDPALEVVSLCEDEAERAPSRPRRSGSLLESTHGLCLEAWMACGIVPIPGGGDRRDAASAFARLAARASHADGDDDLLYGRAGLLHGCLAVLQSGSAGSSDTRRIVRTAGKLVADLVESGSRHGRGDRGPWLWPWHGKGYVGLIHGAAGVVAQLAQCPSEVVEASGVSRAALERGVVATCEWIASLASRDGHFPSSVNSSARHPLVQICHGAPGVLIGLCTAGIHVDAVRRSPAVNAAAESAAEATWRHGLLRKGPGLCHGISGNAMSLLSMARFTGDSRWVRRAEAMLAFANHRRSRHGSIGSPDRPMSLFEGEAGLLFAMAGVRDPERARFPGVEV